MPKLIKGKTAIYSYCCDKNTGEICGGPVMLSWGQKAVGKYNGRPLKTLSTKENILMTKIVRKKRLDCKFRFVRSSAAINKSWKNERLRWQMSFTPSSCSGPTSWCCLLVTNASVFHQTHLNRLSEPEERVDPIRDVSWLVVDSPDVNYIDWELRLFQIDWTHLNFISVVFIEILPELKLLVTILN